MKDAYSFDVDEEGLHKSYQDEYDAYTRIFTRCGLEFKQVEADSGQIGRQSQSWNSWPWPRPGKRKSYRARSATMRPILKKLWPRPLIMAAEPA